MPTLGIIVAGAYFAVFALALLWNGVTALLAASARALRARQLHDEPSVDHPACVITLVHGTWARRAAWTFPGSPLRQRVSGAALGPVAFKRFVWSGRNSLSARQQAVRGLIEHLHAAIERWPHARHYVIAHSHGGNIAFHALRDRALNERIHGLICLSTPFLTVMPRDLGPVGHVALWWLPVILILYGGVFALRLVAPASEDSVGPVLLLVALAAGFLISSRLKRFAISGLDALDYPVVDASKVLIVRAAGDEASAALGATHIISWVSGRVWLFTSRTLGRTVATVDDWRTVLTRHRFVTGLLIVGLALATVWAFVRAPPSGDTSPLQQAGIASGFLLLLIIAMLFRGGLVATILGAFLFAALAAPFLMIVAVLGMSVGPELLAAGLLFQVTAEPTPPGRWVVWQMSAERNKSEVSGLMHSASYQSAAALEIVEQWLASDAPSQ